MSLLRQAGIEIGPDHMQVLIYAAVIEKAEGNRSYLRLARLLRCQLARRGGAHIREALAFHRDGMREDGLAVLSPKH